LWNFWHGIGKQGNGERGCTISQLYPSIMKPSSHHLLRPTRHASRPTPTPLSSQSPPNLPPPAAATITTTTHPIEHARSGDHSWRGLWT
jgi:hypothetical protein